MKHWLLPIKIFVVILSCANALAHDHNAHSHHSEMQSDKPKLDGESIYNIESKWLNTEGKTVDLKSLQGSPQILAMLYTSCQTACPLLVGDIKNVFNGLSPDLQSKVRMTILSFDPKRDTPLNLQKFAAKMKLDTSKWLLLSPKSQAEVNTIAAALGVRFKKLESGDYIHSNIIFLIDPEGRIVATKEGLNNSSPEFNAKTKDLLSKGK